MRNIYFSAGARAEQNLYEDLIIESIKIYGHESLSYKQKVDKIHNP